LPGSALRLVGLDGVDVAGGGRERHVDALLAGLLQQLLEQEMPALRALAFDDGGQASIHSRVSWLSLSRRWRRREQVVAGWVRTFLS
jgi:hypothetical protein